MFTWMNKAHMLTRRITMLCLRSAHMLMLTLWDTPMKRSSLLCASIDLVIHGMLANRHTTQQCLPFGRRFVLTLRDVRTGRASRLRAKFIMVTHGILAGQYTLQQRGLEGSARFAGTISLAGREGGRDCAVSNTDLTGKVRAGQRAFALVCGLSSSTDV